MPTPVSKKQFRYLKAIAADKKGKGEYSSRGDRVPHKIAESYDFDGVDYDSLPETKGKEQSGGTWGVKGHLKHRKANKDHRHYDQHAKRKKEKAKKSEEILSDLFKSKGVGIVVVNEDGNILLGKQKDGYWSTPGGHVESGEDFYTAAQRELKEESNLRADALEFYGEGKTEGNDSKWFIAREVEGKLRPGTEFRNFKYVPVAEIPWEDLRPAAKVSLAAYVDTQLEKTNNISFMLAKEKLEKNVLRGADGRDAVFAMTHGDALRLVGNSTFRWLKSEVDEMSDEDFKDIELGDHKIHIRKHMNDVYSGRIYDGQKLVHQFHKRSLPEVAAQLMSVFEWYAPEDEGVFELIDESSLPQDAVKGGIRHLMDNYKRHNIGEIYDEMENIRDSLRNEVNVDVMQVENRMMKLFDKLEETVHDFAEKHNVLASSAGTEIEQLEAKLRELQSKLDDIESKPTVVEAVSASKPNSANKILEDYYPYLTKPTIEISPEGRIKISFSNDWSEYDRENLLKDMKAKVLKKKKSLGGA